MFNKWFNDCGNVGFVITFYQLQQRNKWEDIKPSATIGDVLLVKEGNLPPWCEKRQLLMTSILEEMG